MAQDVPENCEVCDEPMDAVHNASCAFCNRVFHLTWDTRLEIKDCGRFDIDDQTLAMYFTCDRCVSEHPPPMPGMQEVPGMPPGFPGAPPGMPPPGGAPGQ